MALVDTWASTSAGAMTLTENGLYTVEAWRLFLSRLRPGGVLAVSRWYAPKRIGETARLLSLAVASLSAEGVTELRSHLVLAGAGRVAILIVGRDALPAAGLSRVAAAADRFGFRLLVWPGQAPTDPLLARLAAAGSAADLAQATAHADLDLAPPTDDRPFFFNMARPGSWLAASATMRDAGGVLGGNLRATDTLFAILLTVALLVVVTLVGPLVARGHRHGLDAASFVAAAAIGAEAAALHGGFGWATASALVGRAAVAISFTAPLGFVLGFPFPLGLRLLRRRSAAALSWMWGLNGALGVLGSVVAVVISLFWGIGWCLVVGAVCYLALLVPGSHLSRRGPGNSGKSR